MSVRMLFRIVFDRDRLSMSALARRQQSSQGRLPEKLTIRPSDEKQGSTKPPPPLARVSETACLCFTFSRSRMMITLSVGYSIRQSSRYLVS